MSRNGVVLVLLYTLFLCCPLSVSRRRIPTSPVGPTSCSVLPMTPRIRTWAPMAVDGSKRLPLIAWP